MATTAQILNVDYARHHRERIAYLNERFARAHGDEGRAMIQQLIDAENLRWKIITDSQPQPTHE